MLLTVSRVWQYKNKFVFIAASPIFEFYFGAIIRLFWHSPGCVDTVYICKAIDNFATIWQPFRDIRAESRLVTLTQAKYVCACIRTWYMGRWEYAMQIPLSNLWLIQTISNIIILWFLFINTNTVLFQYYYYFCYIIIIKNSTIWPHTNIE